LTFKFDKIKKKIEEITKDMNVSGRNYMKDSSTEVLSELDLMVGDQKITDQNKQTPDFNKTNLEFNPFL